MCFNLRSTLRTAAQKETVCILVEAADIPNNKQQFYPLFCTRSLKLFPSYILLILYDWLTLLNSSIKLPFFFLIPSH